jgi:hypothetical protein
VLTYTTDLGVVGTVISPRPSHIPLHKPWQSFEYDSALLEPSSFAFSNSEGLIPDIPPRGIDAFSRGLHRVLTSLWNSFLDLIGALLELLFERTPVGVGFCSLLDLFTTFHPLPRPVTSSDVKGTCLSNDDVVRLDLQDFIWVRRPLMG